MVVLYSGRMPRDAPGLYLFALALTVGVVASLVLVALERSALLALLVGPLVGLLVLDRVRATEGPPPSVDIVVVLAVCTVAAALAAVSVQYASWLWRYLRRSSRAGE